ncbi:transglycosylase family protein [Dialister succinatiphilus]|uniref:transglycosylase family protein n=1 Tax=Dialister succinatiphilus TaxID=487173 RepID=UPI003AF09DBD
MDWSKERANFLSQATQGPSDEPDNELIPTKGNYTYANPELAALERGAVNVGRSILGIPAMLAGTAGATAPSVSADMAMDMDGYTPLDSSLQSGVNQALDTAHDTTAPVWNGIENNSRYLASKLPEDWHANKEVGAVRGFADTVLENAPQMALQAGLAMVNPALSAAVLAGSTGGGEYLDLRDKGVDPGTAGQASLLNAAAQTPLEYIPMEKWINARRILGKHGLLKTIGVPMASEGVTEAIQEIPDEMTSYYAEHGTLDGFDYNKLGLNAAEAGAVGAVYGGLFAGINAAVHKPIEENANEPQNTADAEPSVEEPSVEEPSIEEPTVEAPDAEEPQGPSVDSSPQNNFTIADDANFDGEADNTKSAAYAVINEFKRLHPDVEITLTSGKRDGDGSSHHDTGNAFDVVSPAFEGEDGRALRDEYGEIARSMGLTPFDEYNGSGNEQYARGENFHITVPEDWHAPQSADPASTILDAIGGQESGGDYTAENGSTGAYGKYQITDDTWNTYADKAGVGKDAERTPENQEKVAKYMMDKYYKEYGTDGAIIAWYAGEGTAEAFVNGELSDEALHRPQPGGPSIADYLASVKSRMKAPVGGGTTGSAGRSIDITPTKSAEDFLKDLESSMPLDTKEHNDLADDITDVLQNGTKEDWERKAREYGWNPPEEAKTATQETAQQEPVQQTPTQQAPSIQPIPKAAVLPEPKPIQRMERTKPASVPAFANSINGRAVKSSNKSENGRIKVDSSAVKNLPTYEEGQPNPDYDSPINGREELNRRMGNEYDNRNSAGNIGNGGGIYQGYSANRGELNNRMQNEYGNKVNPFIQKALQNPVLTNLVKRAYVDGDMAAMQRLEALKINPNVISAVREKVEGETNANTKKNGRVLYPTQENHNVNPKSQEGSVQKGKTNESTEAEQGVTYQAPINGREELGQRMRNDYANSNGVANIGNANTAPITGSVPNRAELGKRMRNAYANNNAYSPTEVPAVKPSNNEWVNERHSKIDSIKSDADSGKITPLEAKKRLNRVMASARLKHGISDSDRADIRNHAIQANNAIEQNSKPKNIATKHKENSAPNNSTKATNDKTNTVGNTESPKEAVKPKEAPKESPAKAEPKKARTDDEIISDAEDKMVRIANFYQKGLITSDEAQNRIVDAYKASYKEVKSVKAKEKLNTTMRGVVYKVTHQTVEESGNGSFETFRKGVMEDAKKLLDSPKFLSFDKKAKEILGEKLYNDVYLPTLSQLLMGDRSVKTSAGESALLFTKMVKSFHDNYGFDVSPLYIFADRGKRRKTETVEINGVKYASSTLGSYNALTNIISLSSQARKETFMHESAHFYMAMLRKYSTLTDNEIDKYFGGNKAEAEKAIQKIRKDLATIEKWASYNKSQLKEYKGTKLESEFTDRANKIEKGDESERSAWLDERFARGFEQYLAEGKAPSKELEGVFSRFKKWLLDIYNGIKGLNQKELSPEIQKFYDSMINGDNVSKREYNKENGSSSSGGNENVSANVQKAGKEAGRLDGGKLEGVQPVVGGEQGQPSDIGSDRNSGSGFTPGHGGAERTHRRVLTNSQAKDYDKISPSIHADEWQDQSHDLGAFSMALDKARAANKHGSFVDPKTPEDLKDAKHVVMTSDGLAGFAIEKDGNIVGLFKSPKKKAPEAVYSLLTAARALGGVKMDCYGVDLVGMYERAGYKVVARIPFTDKYIKKNADGTAADPHEQILLDKRPDVFALMANGDDFPTATETIKKRAYKTSTEEDLNNLPVFDGADGYNNALAYRDALLAGDKKKADEILKKSSKRETVRTDNGKEFKVTYRVMEADDVISSNTADFVPDNRYPPQLQPRDRSRKTMKEQVDGMSRSLSPSDLAGSRNVNEGAPIINGDNVVENGNGRTMAIKRAYALEGKGYEDSAKAYKNYLIEHAEEYGYTPEEIKEMKNPILVRERSSESDVLQKDIIHSTAGGMEMSSSQRAKSDAEKITPQITRLYNYDGSGDLTLESNREFVATVLNTIAGKNEKDRLFDSDGNPSKEGIERVKNAMTAAAYENNELIDRMGESTYDDMRNVVKAYAAVSPRVASVAKRIETGDVLESYDLPKVLSDALSIYFKCKGNKKAIQNELDTPSLFGGDKVSAPVKEFVMFMADNTRKPRAISDAISRMVDYVDGANEKSADLWEGTRRTLDECVDAAIHEPPKYLITNKNLKATDEINVVKLTGKIKKGPLGPISTQLARKLKDCVFHIGHEGVDVGFFSSYGRKHFTFGGEGIPRNSKVRRWAISDEQNIKKIIENSVYVEEEENRHLDEPEPRNHRNDKFHFAQFMSVVKSGNSFVRFRISALKLPDGTFEVKDVGLYEIAPAGYIKKSFVNKKEHQLPQAATNKREDLSRVDTLYTVSVADALTGVKDRKGRLYVKDGKLQYDARVHPVKNMISSETTSTHTTEVMKNQVMTNFPNAKNVEITESSMSFDLPNGKHLTVNFTDNTIGVDFNSAQKDYGGKLSGNERAVGKLETVGEDVIMTLSTDTVEQVPAHEAMHLAMNFLTERERKALEAKFGGDEEAMCEAYRKWKIARANRRGTMLGKIWQKIADVGRKLIGLFETHFHETADNVFRKVSEGQMWERKEDNDSARKVAYMMIPSNEVLKNLKGVTLKAEGTLESRFKPEYAKAKLNKRITVKERPQSDDWGGMDVALNNTILSPSRIKDPIVRRMFRLGDEATKTQQKLHNRWTRKHTEALSLLKTKKEQDMYDSLMFSEDFNGKVYSKAELKAQGVPESVIKCHERSRNLLRQIYDKVNDVYTHAHVETKTFESEQDARDFLDDLEERPHTEILTGVNKVTFDGNTAYQVSYKTGRYWTRTATLDDKMLEALQNDKDCHIVKVGSPHETPLGGNVTTVTFLSYAKPLTNMEGYVPHIFHDWMIIRRYKDDKGEVRTEVVGSATSGEKAVVKADELSKKMSGDFLIAGKKLSSEGEIENPLLLGDTDYENLMGNLTSGTTMTLAKAKELTHAIKEGRHVYFGALRERKGAKGYETNARWAIQHHIDSAARYCALDPFKENAINLFERAYGRYADDWKGKSWAASFSKGYIDSMLGKPGTMEKVMNDLLNSIPVFRNMQRPGKRISSALLGFTSVLKLGASPSSALVNVLQICNANGYIGPKWVKLGLSKARHPSLTDLKILKALGTDDEVGLGANSDFGKVRLEENALGRFTDTYNMVADKIMKPFTYAEHLIRRATVLGAYYKRYNELTGDHDTKDRIAKKYALDINRKVNFDYSTADSPRVFRALRGTIVGDLMLQFQKYGTKELEVISDFIPTSSSTTAKQKAMFFVPYLLIGGLWNAAPFEDLILNILGLVTGVDDPEKEAKRAMMEWAGHDTFKRALVDVANYGAGAIVGTDISQRVGLKGAVPEADSALKGGAFGSTVTGLARGILNADAGSALKSVMPEAGNIYQAMVGYTTDSKGRKVVDLDGWDRAMKVLGFRTTREAEATDVQGILYNYKETRNADRAKARLKYAEDKSTDNYNKLIELGYTPKQIKALEKESPKEQGRVDRAQKGLSKADKKELAGVIDYAK